ncbi:MAG TPA: CBS domain-containing protein [Mycobacteriales bacterium]|nr:CBS domain-containing protein [Mycobacteriales bacterium]
MKASEIMSTPVVTVRPDTKIVDAAQLLVRHKIAALPVVDARHRMVGLVSEADLFHASAAAIWTERASPTETAPRPRPPQRVADIMHRDVLWVRHDDSLALCASLMTRHNGRSLPVLRRGLLVGIVTRRDVLGALTRDDTRRQPQPEATAGTGGIDLLALERRHPVT